MSQKQYDTKQLLLWMTIIIGTICILVLIFSPSSQKNTTRETYSEESRILLTKLKQIMDTFVHRLAERYPKNESVRLLKTRYTTRTRLKEASETYTLNKGEEIMMCMRNYKEGGKPHRDLNLLVFVALHELGHVMSITVHHTDEFWKNFRFLLEEAASMGYYEPVDYANDPVAYCTMTVYDNPFFYEKTKEDHAEEFQNLLFKNYT